MDPRLSKRTLTAIQKVITGDEVPNLGAAVGPYRSGPRLVEFFNEFGFNDSYSRGGGFPTRSVFADERLDRMNGQARLVTAIEAVMNPVEFIDTDFTPEAAAEHLNKYLAYDGWEVVPSSGRYRLRRSGESLVECEATLAPEQHASHEAYGAAHHRGGSPTESTGAILRSSATRGPTRGSSCTYTGFPQT